MQENKNLVEEALIQMKNVEEAIAENAKGILASTMKEEISQLVKESLSEQEELDLDAEVNTTDADDEDDTDVSLDANFSDDDSDEMEVDMDMNVDSDNPMDLRDASDEFILKVFKSMGEDDGIIVKKDGDDIHLTDNNTDSEYLVKNLGESEEENYENMEYNEEEDEDVQDVIDAIFSDTSDVSDVSDNSGSDDTMMSDEEEVVYEIEFTEDDDSDDEIEESDDEIEESEEMDESDDMEESEEMDESDDMEESEEMDEEDWQMDESYNHKKSKKVETKESKMSVKPKGVGMGKAKFSYKKSSGGFSEDKKEGPKTMGTGKAKFEYKKGENMEGTMKPLKKKVETKEAARTYAFGSKDKSRGLRKGVTPNRNLTFESLETEVSSLREKNEEYRKALNVFREKLNEVAVFNSNLAYATRLFTEHSTTKKEKINILRRFDDVDSLKESKGLYRVIKEELTKTDTKSLNESVGNKLTKSVQSGSSTTLIESKTYENPQFMRIKDLITKIG
jgi:hypothetical protein